MALSSRLLNESGLAISLRTLTRSTSTLPSTSAWLMLAFFFLLLLLRLLVGLLLAGFAGRLDRLGCKRPLVEFVGGIHK